MRKERRRLSREAVKTVVAFVWPIRKRVWTMCRPRRPSGHVNKTLVLGAALEFNEKRPPLNNCFL